METKNSSAGTVGKRTVNLFMSDHVLLCTLPHKGEGYISVYGIEINT